MVAVQIGQNCFDFDPRISLQFLNDVRISYADEDYDDDLHY